LSGPCRCGYLVVTLHLVPLVQPVYQAPP
jgi:hypothetical protein